LDRVVQDVGHQTSDEGLRRERHVYHVVELSEARRNIS
jgi:hypothetical protein